MQKKPSGYKGKLRDRCPRTVDIALKWCESKNKWVDHVYDHHVRFLTDKKERAEQVNIILGLSKKNRFFEFKDTIDWHNITEDEKNHWEYVQNWVDWFCENYLYIQNEYMVRKSKGDSEENIKDYIKRCHLSLLTAEWQEKLVIYILKYIKESL